MGYRIETIDSLRKTLEELPQVNEAEREISKQEAVGRMAPEVLQLTKRGYSWEAIADILSRGGLPITASTLKSYMGRAKRHTGGRVRKGPGPAREHVAKPQKEKTNASPERKPAPLVTPDANPDKQAGGGRFTPRKDSIDI